MMRHLHSASSTWRFVSSHSAKQLRPSVSFKRRCIPLQFQKRGVYHGQQHLATSELHDIFTPTKNSTRHTPKVSEAQRRSAQSELEQMTQSTSRLLAMKDSAMITDAIINEARVVLNYWSRRWYMHFHPGFGRAAKGSALSLDALRSFNFDQLHTGTVIKLEKTGEDISLTENMSGSYGAHQAERLLDWSISHNLVPRGIFDNDVSSEHDFNQAYGNSPNLVCVNIIETYLLPCHYGGVGGFGYSNDEQKILLLGESQRHYATLSKHFTMNSYLIQAVVDAIRVMKKMKELQELFPDELSPDTLSIISELNVWSKRAAILGKDHDGIHTGGIIAGKISGGHSSSADRKDVLKTLETEEPERLYTVEGCLHEMESVLTGAEHIYTTTKRDSIKPSVHWYNHVLGAWARSDLDGAKKRANEILRGMEIFAGAQDDTGVKARTCLVSPDIVSYNSMLFSLGRNSDANDAKKALECLHELNNRYKQTRNPLICPDEITFGTVLHALAQVGMAQEAESILDDIEASDTLVPSLTIYNSVLNAWANSSERDAPRRAEFLLDRMKTLSSTGKNPDAEPDTVSVSTVMSCHARSNTRKGAERAEELLDQAINSYSMGNARMKPDSIMFNCASLGWAHCSSSSDEDEPYAKIPAERAEMILEKMHALRENGTLDVHPVAQTFNIVLDSWSKSEIKGAAERALSLMRKMPEAGVTPDEVSYNSVLHSISKEEDPSWVNRAVEMFKEMKQLRSRGEMSLSNFTYNVMMTVYGKSLHRDGAGQAENLLRSMKSDDLSPDITSYNICIDAYARRGDFVKAEAFVEEMMELVKQGRTEYRPTIHTFASIVYAFSNSRESDAIDRAESVVRKVEEMDYISPNNILYNSLLDCMMKHGGDFDRAEEILHRMERLNLRPDPYAYSMVLTLCARSKSSHAGTRAQAILDEMELRYSEGRTSVIANSRCYSAVITAWARSGAPDAVQRSIDLLDRMEKNRRLRTQHGYPNTHCYNACIHSVAKSSQPKKVSYCRDILRRMTEATNSGFNNCAPTVVTYSTVVNACAFTGASEQEQKEAFDLARTCFQTVLDSSHLEPDESFLGNFFLVIFKHLGPGDVRDQISEAVFHEGCRQGVIDDYVVHNFRKASPRVAQKMLNRYKYNGRSLPREWSRNIKR